MAIEVGDLEDVLKLQIEVDVYKSKIGRDDKNCVISFFVEDREAANDLTAFFEKGYNFVLDADVSSGEVAKNLYVVFVEIRRLSTLYDHVHKLLMDLRAACSALPEDWSFRYKRQRKFVPLTREAFDSIVPLSSRKYRKINDKPLNDMRQAAGLPVKNPPVEDEDIKNFQHLAGL